MTDRLLLDTHIAPWLDSGVRIAGPRDLSNGPVSRLYRSATALPREAIASVNSSTAIPPIG